MTNTILKPFVWVFKRLKHKVQHFSFASLKDTFKEHGAALVVIIVFWEIIEDILFPIMFAILGKYVHPGFYAGMPISWLLCMHWLVVPVTWAWWVKLRDSKNEN
jgi:hypothetical protein